MSNYLKFTGCLILLIYYFKIIECGMNQKIKARHKLIRKERDYFKRHPISSELRQFIEKIKLEHQPQHRSKRYDSTKLYTFENGHLVPIETNQLRRREETESYTVVPLILPLRNKEIKLRESTKNNNNLDIFDLIDDTPSSNIHHDLPRNDENITIPPTTTKENTIDESEEENKSDDAILGKILEDIEGLMSYTNTGNKREGTLCKIEGSWNSGASGMRLDLKMMSDTKFSVNINELEPPSKEESFLCNNNGNWTIFGELPFKKSSLIVLVAINEGTKHAATFIGECRVCEGSEAITGTWLIGRSSKDCKDQKSTHKILEDVWRKDNVKCLQKKHLEEIGYTVK